MTVKSSPFTASMPSGYVFLSPRTLIAGPFVDRKIASFGCAASHHPRPIRHCYDGRRREDVTVVMTDELAQQFEQNRAHLRAVAYRMLGSASEAEDAVQEAWLRLTRSDSAEVTNLGGWLTTVVGRVCLDMLRARRARREELVGSWVPEPVVSEVEDGLGQPVVSEVEDGDPEQEALLADSVGVA